MHGKHLALRVHEQALQAAVDRKFGNEAHAGVHTHAIELDDVWVPADVLEHRRFRHEVHLGSPVLHTHRVTVSAN